MIRIAKKYLNWWMVMVAVIFLCVQIGADLMLPTITGDLINKGVVNRDFAYIWHQGGIMLIVAALGLLGSSVNVYAAATQAMQVGVKLRQTIFEHVLTFSNREMSHFGDSSLITRSTNDVIQIQNVLVQMLRMMLMAPIMLVGAIVIAYTREPRLTKVFLISLPVLAVAVMIIMWLAVPLFKSMQGKTDRINLVFREGLTGVRVIRAFNQDETEQTRFAKANEDYTATGIKAFTLVSLLFPIMTLVLSLTNVGLIWLGGHYIANMSMEVGDLVAFMTYSTQILISFMMLSMIFVFVPRASASASRINEILATTSSVTDPENPATFAPQAASLTFDNVNLRYDHAEDLSLADVNFTANAGQTVAIIGGTGSGKSSLVNLIPRLLNPEQGRILLNGQDISHLTQADVHRAVAITQQKAVLFTGTIRSNLLFGNPKASEELMWHVLDIAQATDFVKENGGLDAEVEENGANFSGGQRQRLAIARTLIKDASVYIFDDSFSALDFKTDAALRAALKADERLQAAVKVIVAQRVSTVMDADVILVLDDGRVVGQGTHDELAKSNAVYQEIIDSQLRKGA